MRTIPWLASLLPVLCILGLASSATAATVASSDSPLQREYTLNGEFVHDVGELQLHVTNFGLIGARSGASCSFCDAPSARWPGVDGVDHLFQAGLWIGARVDGEARVTTSAGGGLELRANPEDPFDTLYAGFEGAPDGARFPAAMPDDDGDGLEDEDPLNGRDDDGDGAIDEDFAGISDQSFRVELTDDDPVILVSLPDHEPLHLKVVQQSFAWSEDSLDQTIGFEFTITASEDFPADQVLEDVYVAFFADPDVGPSSSDDLSFYDDVQVRASDGSTFPLQYASVYDADTDGGQTPGRFGIALIDHPTDPAGIEAPATVGVRSYQSLVGNRPFEQGGDPGNDAERYDLMSRDEIDPNPNSAAAANDFRFLISVGPFARFDVDDEITVRWVMAVGDTSPEQGLERALADGKLSGIGRRYDRDGDPSNGLEFRVPWVSLADGPVSIDDPEVEDDVPSTAYRSALLPNAPNPFNPSTTIRFRLPVAGSASLSIHDAAGRRVRTVDLGHRGAGEGSWVWNGKDDAGRGVASGTYLVRLRSERGVDARAVVLLK